MLLLTLLMCFSPRVLGQLEESQFGDDTDSDFADFDLDIVRDLKDEGVVHSGGFSYLTPFFCTHRLHAGSHGR